MTRRAAPVAVGAFVLVGLSLLIAGIAVLGGGRWFGATDSFVIHFDETLRGLRVGAPVAYRGVQVGEVVSITAVLEPEETELTIPVVVRLRKDALRVEGGGEPTPETLQRLIDRGLRAQLQIESLVTARLFIELNMFPGSRAVYQDQGSALPEIPSVRSPIAGISTSLDQLTMAAPQLLEEATRSLEGLRQILSGETGDELRRGLRAAADLAARLDAEDGDLRRTLVMLPDTVAASRTLIASFERLATEVTATVESRDRQLGALLAEAEKILPALRRAAEGASGMVADNRQNLAEFTDRGLPQIVGLVEDANRMVNELSSLVRDVRQNPARFLFGDPTAGGVRLQ